MDRHAYNPAVTAKLDLTIDPALCIGSTECIRLVPEAIELDETAGVSHPLPAASSTDRTTITISGYDAIREALFDPNLTRSFDGRSYAEGNIRDGVVSVSHGTVHRARRRVENAQFRAERLQLYERELFPKVLDRMLGALIDRESVDLFAVGELVSVVLAARRAGLDIDEDSMDQLRELVHIVDVFSQGSAILDARDPAAVRALVYETYDLFDRRYIQPAWDRRATLVAAQRLGDPTTSVPHDILTVLLLHRDDPALELDDRGRVVREVATYLQGGTHTSAQTLTNAVDLLFAERDAGRELFSRMAGDLACAQRVVHETLRLRPTTPRIKRRALADTRIAGVDVPKDALVVLDAATANRERALFGPDADAFQPDRRLAAGVPRWGLSFGGGPHQCPGRSVAGGFPLPDGEPDVDHLYGLVALMLQGIARRAPRPDPDSSPDRDTRTERHTRWARYPVRFERWQDPA
jgi:cytochrome P450